MSAFRGVLLDLDGVLYVGRDPLPGALDALARLRRSDLAIGFVTNTTRRSRRRIRADLHAMGIDVADDELHTPARAAGERLRTAQRAPYLLIHPGLAEDFADWPGDGTQAVVVGDAGDGFTYDALNHAFRLIEAGAPLLALAMNRYFREANGLSLDAGPFVAALQYASGAEAELFGKPSPGFFHAALSSLDCRAEEVVMVGDDVEADVNGAIAAGLAGILVRTGKFRPDDERRIVAGGKALDDLAAVVDRLLASG